MTPGSTQGQAFTMGPEDSAGSADLEYVTSSASGTQDATASFSSATDWYGLAAVFKPAKSSLTTTYAYNGDGLRMSETAAGGATQEFTWATLGSLPGLLADGHHDYLYAPGSSTPLEQISVGGAQPSFLVADTTGIREKLSTSGAVVGSATYATYGTPCSTCVIGTPFGFAGGYRDQSGLVYLLHRYYDPSTGQFISVDPDLASTGAPYQYVGGDPVNLTDPTGLRLPIAVSCSTSCVSETPTGLGDAGASPTPMETNPLQALAGDSPAVLAALQTVYDLQLLQAAGYPSGESSSNPAPSSALSTSTATTAAVDAYINAGAPRVSSAGLDVSASPKLQYFGSSPPSSEQYFARGGPGWSASAGLCQTAVGTGAVVSSGAGAERILESIGRSIWNGSQDAEEEPEFSWPLAIVGGLFVAVGAGLGYLGESQC